MTQRFLGGAICLGALLSLQQALLPNERASACHQGALRLNRDSIPQMLRRLAQVGATRIRAPGAGTPFVMHSGTATQFAPLFEAPTRPARLESTDFYRDGGTVWVRLRELDGSDTDCGFSRWDGDSARGRLFFGAKHPTMPGASFLNLWSPEEGALLAAIREAVADSIPEENWTPYLRARSVDDLPDTNLNGLWHLIVALNFREQFYRAVQAGHLASIESALKYAGLSGGLEIRSIHVDRKMEAFEVSLRDSAGKDVVILSHGLGLGDEMCFWTFGRRLPPNINVIDGGHFDSRYALALLELALRDPLFGEYALRRRFPPASDDADRLRLLNQSVENCKRWFLERDRAIGGPP